MKLADEQIKLVHHRRHGADIGVELRFALPPRAPFYRRPAPNLHFRIVTSG
jgi:hypothetical protein